MSHHLPDYQLLGIEDHPEGLLSATTTATATAITTNVTTTHRSDRSHRSSNTLLLPAAPSSTAAIKSTPTRSGSRLQQRRSNSARSSIHNNSSSSGSGSSSGSKNTKKKDNNNKLRRSQSGTHTPSSPMSANYSNNNNAATSTKHNHNHNHHNNQSHTSSSSTLLFGNLLGTATARVFGNSSSGGGGGGGDYHAKNYKLEDEETPGTSDSIVYHRAWNDHDTMLLNLPTSAGATTTTTTTAGGATGAAAAAAAAAIYTNTTASGLSTITTTTTKGMIRSSPSSNGSMTSTTSGSALALLSPLEVELQPLNEDVQDTSHQGWWEDCIDTVFYSNSSAQRFRTGYTLRAALEQWLFPPHIPRSCQLLRPENIAVPACYLMVGMLQGLLGPLVNVFPLDLGATEAQQTTVSSIRGLPSSFKLLFGFLSDTLPLYGYRRKPYMFLGWLFTSLSFLMLLLFSNTHLLPSATGCFGGNAPGEDAAPVEAAPLPENAPSIAFFSVALLGFGSGFWLADVMGDSIVAERAKLEPPESRGTLQSSCYAYRFFGKMIAAPMATYLYSVYGPYMVIAVLAFLPLTILPLVWMFVEIRDIPVRPVKDQCQEIWNTVCSRAVWQPMGFVYLYNVMQVSNAAWREFLVTALHFTSCQLNLLLVTSLVLLWLGILTYKHCFMTMSWRKVYMFTTTMNGFFSLMQVLLIYGITFGISNFLFALGDDAFVEFLDGIQFLPTTIMMVHLCPTGSEGASYAMFTTVNNSALSLSSAMSTVLLRIWDVSKQALAAGQLQGMVNLTCLTTAIQVSAIMFVGLLPNYKEDLHLLKEDGQSKLGGAIFLGITFMTLFYAISVGFLNIVFPGWMGES